MNLEENNMKKPFAISVEMKQVNISLTHHFHI